MSSTATYSFSIEEGQHLLLNSKAFALPEKLGETKFQEVERTEAALEVLALWKAIKTISPNLTSPGRKTLFGPSENWRPLLSDENTFVAVDIAIKVEVLMSEDAQAGALWCCLLSTHPLSQKLQPNDIVDGIFIPIARKLGREADLMAMISPPKKERVSRWAKKS